MPWGEITQFSFSAPPHRPGVCASVQLLNDLGRLAERTRSGKSRSLRQGPAGERRRPIWWVSRQGEVAMKATKAVAPGNGTSDIARPGHRQ